MWKSIQVIKNKNIGSHWGYLYASLFFVSGLLGSIILHQYIQIAFVTSLRTRSCLLTAIYRKIFVLCNFDRDDFAVGEIINLMTVDTQKCYDLLPSFNMVWSAPFQIIVALIYLYLLMGWSVLAGFGILILFVPITCCFSVYEMKFQVKQMVFKDSRYKLINEIVAGINVLKLYSWENSFIAKVMNFRNDEVKLIKKAMFLQATHSFVLTLVPILVSLSTFTVYVLLGNNLDAEKAFVAVSLFNIMKFPLFSLPLVIANIAQYNVSAKRLSKFLKSDELNPVSVSNDKNITSAVEIHNGTFKWNIQNEPILNNVNLKIPCGSLTAVVGQVGSGKSSLISAILGEIKRVGGDVFVKGSISYVSQQPWIQNKSLRDNILFVSKYKALKYNKIIDACALRADISTLVDEDRTEIGENGINLSGGQKQRISIARAVYHNSDIYIMDDSLSAVDAHVGKHIFDQVIGKKGLLNNKTRLFVTNDLTYLPYVDQIIVLSENKILKCGSYEELINNSANADFYKDLYHGVYNRDQVERTNTVENNESVKDLKVNFEVVRKFTSPISKISHYVLAFTNCALAAFSFDECLKVLQKMKLNINMGNYYDLEKNELYQREASEILKRREKIDFLKDSNRTKVLISDEIFTTGKVNQSVYWTYARCVGILITMIFLCFGLITEGFSLSSRVWLAEWSSDKNVLEKTRNMYLGIYGALGIGQGLSSWLQAYIICFGVTNASKALHYNLLTNVLRCPMIFFETTPMGRIVNRFSKDINLIDESIPKSLKSFVSCLLTLLSTIAIISYTTPIFLAIFFLIGVVYILIQRIYVSTSVQLQRMESIRRSPVYSHFFETVSGVSTIRALKISDEFISENESRIDFNQEVNFQILSLNRWLALRLEICGHVISMFAAMLCILGRENLSPGMVGLSISYALQVTQTLNWLVRLSSELENDIISVERIKEYIDVPTEAAAIVETCRPSQDWPKFGAVAFHNICLRYRCDLDFVLNDISFNVEPSEKIGLVGRTGAGKSSIANALFRITEAASGSILIDNVDISTIGLHDLRSRITIIPQNPILYSGTLRFNIDPFDQFNDEEILRVLDICNLKLCASNLESGLLYEILEGGSNLSVGQRQLICLARAVIRNSKVIVLDEATSSVDHETDSFIQEVIRKEFKSSTVLCIAHRLNTILDYDRIIVLRNGQIIEYDSPKVLFQRQGDFYKMMKDADLSIVID
ncbi:multidrug resistance-associated protein 1-like isoform X2 [Hydra vulgaris]|uniref:Multidrug resistance-associated protein 1-like isoform X2 n=1 Tax=Hydra vulgaris TaxID=6087 RepID=A0ABM4B4T9_HYDVU